MLITLTVNTINLRNVTAVSRNFESTKIKDLQADPTGMTGAAYFVYQNNEGDPTTVYTVAETYSAVIAMIGSSAHSKGALALAANYPAGLSEDFWYVTVGGVIGGTGPTLEVGDIVTCIIDSIGGTHAAVGSSYKITQVNTSPLSVADLRIGTNVTNFATAKAFADQGFVFTSGTTQIATNATLGNLPADVTILKGRTATGTAAGSAIQIDATTCAYSEGLELRYNMADWADGATTFTNAKAMYMRCETDEANAAGSVYGAELYGVTNNVTVSGVWGLLSYGYVKGVTAKSVDRVYGVQSEITWDAGAAATTLGTEAAALLAKITGGQCVDYTKIHGVIVRSGDMDGASRTYGNGILIEDDSSMAGAITWTKGISITSICTTGIDIDTATTGIDIGNCPTGIIFSNVGATGEYLIDVVDAYTGLVIETGSYSSAISKGVTINATNARPVSFLFDDAGVVFATNSDIRPVVSRTYFSLTQTEASVRFAGIRGHMKLASGIDLNGDTSEYYATQGILECAGATTVGANAFAAGVCGMLWADGNFTGTGLAAGVMAKLYQTAGTTTTTSAFAATKWWNSADTWSYGLYIQDATVDAGHDIRMQGGATIGSGSADPSGVISALGGSLYLRTGTADQKATIYINTTAGTGTTWVLCNTVTV